MTGIPENGRRTKMEKSYLFTSLPRGRTCLAARRTLSRWWTPLKDGPTPQKKEVGGIPTSLGSQDCNDPHASLRPVLLRTVGLVGGGLRTHKGLGECPRPGAILITPGAGRAAAGARRRRMGEQRVGERKKLQGTRVSLFYVSCAGRVRSRFSQGGHWEGAASDLRAKPAPASAALPKC
eukprot:gene14286-biopygen18623